MRLYLVRHGETEWNAQGRIQGHTDIPLSDVGRGQVKRTAQRLADVAFAAAYASDLSRAQETARIILDGRGPQVLSNAGLRESNYGEHEGKTWAQLRETDPALDRRVDGVGSDLDAKPPGGESVRDLFARQEQFVGRTLAAQAQAVYKTQDLLVVGHGGSLQALALALIGMPAEYYWHLSGLESASISVVADHRGRMAIHSWNDTGHLA